MKNPALVIALGIVLLIVLMVLIAIGPSISHA